MLTSGLKVGDRSPHFDLVMMFSIVGPLVITVSEIIGSEVQVVFSCVTMP